TVGQRNPSRAILEVQARSLAAAWPHSSHRLARPSFTGGQTNAPASRGEFLKDGPHGKPPHVQEALGLRTRRLVRCVPVSWSHVPLHSSSAPRPRGRTPGGDCLRIVGDP